MPCVQGSCSRNPLRQNAHHSWPNYGSLLRPYLLGFWIDRVLGLLVVLWANMGELLVFYNTLDYLGRSVVVLQVDFLGLAELAY